MTNVESAIRDLKYALEKARGYKREVLLQQIRELLNEYGDKKDDKSIIS